MPKVCQKSVVWQKGFCWQFDKTANLDENKKPPKRTSGFFKKNAETSPLLVWEMKRYLLVLHIEHNTYVTIYM